MKCYQTKQFLQVHTSINKFSFQIGDSCRFPRTSFFLRSTTNNFRVMNRQVNLLNPKSSIFLFIVKSIHFKSRDFDLKGATVILPKPNREINSTLLNLYKHLTTAAIGSASCLQGTTSLTDSVRGSTINRLGKSVKTNCCTNRVPVARRFTTTREV